MVTSAWEGPTRVVWSLIAKGNPRDIVIGVLVRGLRRRQQCAAVGRIAVDSAIYHARWGCAASKCLVSAAIRESAPLRRFLLVIGGTEELASNLVTHRGRGGSVKRAGGGVKDRSVTGSYKLNPLSDHSTQN